ncbi:MAG: hypothetical protein AMS24_00125 [Chlamydiae bacterium SM23_39]|nr:MAG: hypothetical protein AMS24_00125 [Chlamydiae bacterium SM23_39]
MTNNTYFNFISRIKPAHQNDVNAMILAGDSFITGSKDTTIKRWNNNKKTSGKDSQSFKKRQYNNISLF